MPCIAQAYDILVVLIPDGPVYTLRVVLNFAIIVSLSLQLWVGLKPLFRDEILEMEHLTANRGRITAVYFLVT
jgi:hypothetical protein